MPTSEAVKRGNPSILFVDDEESILSVVSILFRKNYDITVTTDPFKAIELLKTKKFHVIVSDQRMPTMTGVELLREARDLAPKTIRILLTGYADMEAIVGAINDVEVYRFLEKPWDNARLKRIVDEAALLASIVDEVTEDDIADDSISFADLAIPKTDSSANRSPAVRASDMAPAASGNKDIVLVTDSKSALFEQVQKEMGDKVDFVHTDDILKVFDILESMPVSVMICSFDVRSKSDRTFLQGMKQAYPHILVIAISDSNDSAYLIELINQAKIFRFVKKPIDIGLLEYHIMNAIVMVQMLRTNPFLLRVQQTEVVE